MVGGILLRPAPFDSEHEDCPQQTSSGVCRPGMPKYRKLVNPACGQRVRVCQPISMLLVADGAESTRHLGSSVEAPPPAPDRGYEAFL